MTIGLAGNYCGANERGATVNNLQYGDALFHFYQQHYFSAISQLLVARKNKPILNQQDDPELLLGGLYLYYGLHNNATNIFNKLLQNNVSETVQDKAWFNIGKMQYLGRQYDSAVNSLSKIGDNLPANRSAERYNILSNIFLKTNQLNNAQELVSKLSDQPDWKAYTEFNIGVSLIKNSEADKGIKFLNNVTNIETDDNELKALRDKAHIALGYNYIQNNQPDQAIQQLGRVRLEGPLSAKALLGLGWAQQQKNQLQQALIPWLELWKRHTLDTAVQESLIAVPYTLEKLEKHQLALQHYKHAIQSYNTELDNIKRIMDHVKSGKLIELLKPENDQEETVKPEYRQQIISPISSPYLSHILASEDFQRAYKDYIELVFLERKLSHWDTQIPAYQLMLNERKKRYTEKFHSTKNDKRLNLLKNLRQKREIFSRQVKKIEENKKLFSLLNEDEQNTYKRLQKIKKTLGKIQLKQDVSEEKEKYRLFYGMFYWNVATDYVPRMWEVKKQLNGLTNAITKAESQLISLKESSKNAPDSFNGFNNRIQKKKSELKKLINRTSALVSRQEKFIVSKALTLLKNRYRQIENYHIRASYSLARLYDGLTLKNEQEK